MTLCDISFCLALPTTAEEESLLHDASSSPVSIMAIVRRTWRMMFVLITVFVVTFLVFPGEIVEIKYQNTISGIGFLAVRRSTTAITMQLWQKKPLACVHLHGH